MTNKLMIGVAVSALMVSGAFAQSSTAPGPDAQSKPSAAAPAKPGAEAPAAKMDKQPAARSESSAENKSDKSKSSAENKSGNAKSENQTAAGAGNKSAGTEAQIVTSQSPDQLLASNFNGTDVIGSDGKKIGDVADILFEKDGTIKAYVISFGGFLGMGAKEVAIAPSAFEIVPGEKGAAKKLKLSMSENQLKSAQKFTEYTPPKPATTTGSGGTMGTAPRPSGGMAPSGKK